MFQSVSAVPSDGMPIAVNLLQTTLSVQVHMEADMGLRQSRRHTNRRGHGQEEEATVRLTGENVLAFVQFTESQSGEVSKSCRQDFKT